MIARQYLTSNDIINIHSRLIDHYGGSKGIRDTELIHSAIGRIKNGYYKNITEEAAALFKVCL